MQQLFSAPQPAPDRADAPELEPPRRPRGRRAPAVAGKAETIQRGAHQGEGRDAKSPRRRSGKAAHAAGEVAGPGDGRRRPLTKDVPLHPVAELLQALSFHHTGAIVYAYLAEVTAETFRGTESKGPKKLLRSSEGVRRADLSSILAIEEALRQAAKRARAELAQLESSSVVTTDGIPISSCPEVALELDEDGVEDSRPSTSRERRA